MGNSIKGATAKLHPLINRYFIAQEFLTRLPVPSRLHHSDAELAGSSTFFPLVGVVIGAAAALAYSIGDLIWSHHMAAIFAIASAALLSGALHEDGLATSADSLGGPMDCEHKSNLMRDNHIGTYGSVALILSILMKFQALSMTPTHLAPWVIICAHSVARWTALPLLIYTPWMREEGTDVPFAANISMQSLAIGTTLTLIIATLCLGTDTILVAAATITFLLAGQHFFKKKQGSVANDTLGAMNSSTELLIYMIFAVQV